MNNKFKSQVVEHIRLLAHASQQLEYEKRGPIAHIPSELISGFCDDLYHPKDPVFLAAFSESELKSLAELYGLLCAASKLSVSSVSELLKSPQWRAVIALAKELEAYYANQA